MDHTLKFLIVIGFLSVTSLTFAGLLAWQYSLRANNNNGTTCIDNASVKPVDNVCPYYPTPQKLNLKSPEFVQLFEWMNTYVASIVNETTRPSVVANLVYRDEIVWSGYFGRLNKSTTQKPDENTIYRIGSISKVFPVIFLFKLWEEGKLSLYDPVEKFAPDFSIGRPYGSDSAIHLIDIASQLSGLPTSLPFNPTDIPFVWNGTLEQAFELLRSQVLAAEPRTKCIYSNLAYPLLADILARNFTDDGIFINWAKINIVDTLGLNNTGFDYPDDVRSRMATGYRRDGSVAPVYDLLWYGPTGNYYSSVADFTKLSMSFLETSTTILKHETLTEILRPRKTCRQGHLANFTGSPWEIDQIDDNLVVRKLGGNDGYAAGMSMVPDLKLAFNIAMSGTREQDYGTNIFEKVIPVFRDVLRKKEPILNPAPNPEKYLGLFTYYNIQYKNITTDESGLLYMVDPNSTESQFKTVGLNYISEEIFTFQIRGGEFPCNSKTAVNLDLQDGTVVHFKNFTDGYYNEIDMPEINVYGYKRM